MPKQQPAPKLICLNEECESRESGGTFSVNLSVDETGQLSERVSKVPSEHFVCNYCQAGVKWEGEDD